MKKRAFVVWAKGETKYSDFLAKGIHADIVVSYSEKFQCALLRYPIQSIDTYKKLKDLKPDVIFVQNPPIFAVLTVYIFCIFNNSQFIIDTHTAGFLDTKWKVFHFLHKFLAKRALYNTAHNYKNLGILKSWGIRNSKTMQFYSPSKEEIIDSSAKLDRETSENLKRYPLKIFMVNRFAADDPYQEVIETARIMPETAFLITGNDFKLKDKNNLPENALLTGFLEHKDFICLMDACDIVLSLTKRPDTLLGSVREAMALGKPIVTSDTEVLRHYYGNFAVFTNHQPEDIKEKIQAAYTNRNNMQEEIKKSILTDREKWNSDLTELNKIIEE